VPADDERGTSSGMSRRQSSSQQGTRAQIETHQTTASPGFTRTVLSLYTRPPSPTFTFTTWAEAETTSSAMRRTRVVMRSGIFAVSGVVCEV